MLGRIEERGGNFQAAFQAFVKAGQLKPELSAAQVGAGMILLMGGAVDQAAERAQAVLEREPENPQALFLKGSVLLGKQDFAAAVRLFEALSTTGTPAPEVYLALATAHARSEQPVAGRTCLRRRRWA